MSNSLEMSEAIDLIRRSTEGLASRRDLARVRALRYKHAGFDQAAWSSMCELGWPALRLAEGRGGVGLSIAAYCALAEEMGAALVPEPLIPAALVAALLEGGPLESHLAGDTLVLPAWQDEPDAAAPSDREFLRDGRLHGAKRFIPMARSADAFLVIAPDGNWLVAADAPGVTLSYDETQDGGHYGTLLLDGVEGEGIIGNAGAALAEACLATSAYLLGVMDAVLERTAEFLKTRIQFGKPLASFQALQHRMVDLQLEFELTRASISDAAARWDREGPTDASLAGVSRAKARAAEAAALIARSSIQLHGGIGYTDEHDIGLYLRKVMVTAPQYGSARLHRQRFAALMPLQSED
ncbi:acyl-CoA dehydrogenase family protein [Sphingobium sp.]|uniref:acyl-CoA dehydrogenase family protein n=1 Tax=Sphingobium sp. TaxID=1912891 RepID=UPI0028BDE9E2|nr:acyl-CoA dehydrogenase family protein [Sphingobium sp.]